MDTNPKDFPFRIDCAIDQGLSLSVSGVFGETSTLAEKDKLVDDLLAVAKRQRAILQKQQWLADLDAKKRVLAQERDRAAKQHEEHDKTPNDFTKQAISASSANIKRLEGEIVGGEAAIAGLAGELRETGSEASA